MDTSLSKKELIIEAAVKVFASRGYYNSRISDIVKEAHTAHGLFYHYYPSKEDILVTIFRNAFKTVLDKMEQIDGKDKNALEKLKSLIIYMFKVFQGNPDLYRVLTMDVPRLSKFYEKENQDLYNRFFVKIADFLKQGQQEGQIADYIPPIIGAHLLHGAVDAVIRQYGYNPDFRKAADTVDTLIDQTVRLLFSGFQT
jgi:TetR/AcrR family fatty acid metabolism transcriptional regulator